MADSGSYPIRSLIQGISQQEDSARGTANAKDQENCLNEVLDGVVSRMGTVVRAAIPVDYSDPFVHEIRYNEAEQYVVLIESGALKVYNKVTGQPATITGDISSYLAHTGQARKAFQAVTIGDTTFILNRQKVVAMSTTKSGARPNQAVAFLKAGGYKLTYTLNIRIGSSTYSASFTTPDNSVPENAAYIATDYIASQFSSALNSTVFPNIAGDGHGTFTVSRYGSTLVITAPAGKDFDIWTTDGVGDTHFISFRDNVKKITDLPVKCVNGYQVSVAGDGSADSSKYFLKYEGGLNTGRWVEVVAPNTPTDLNADTMPHLLVCTAPDTFQVKKGTWGKRLAGDGDMTAQDPSFVGNTINSMQFIGGRLGLVTTYEMTLSKARNAFVYFPDTVQTNLDSAPVDYDVSSGSSTDISHAVAVGDRLQFWGDLQQTYLDSGQDPIKEDTTEVRPLANYEFDGECAPKPIGLSSLLFGTKVGRWAKMTEVFFKNGRPDGEIEISAHVPQLLEGALRYIAVSEAAKKAFILTTGASSVAYLYQWYNQGNDRVQSAWSKWRFDAPEKILWASVQGGTAWFLFKWTSGCTLEYVILDRHGDEPAEKFPLRLDHRVSEASASYSNGEYTITLPYPVPSSKRDGFKAVERKDILDVSQRGRDLEFTWVNNTTVKIASDNSSLKFYFGKVPVARRTFSKFLARDHEDQAVIHDRLLIKKIVVGHYQTVEYSAVVYLNGERKDPIQVYSSRLVADPSVANNEVAIKDGSFTIDVGEVTDDVEVELVNDTVFPAVWRSAKYVYDLTVRGSQ